MRKWVLKCALAAIVILFFSPAIYGSDKKQVDTEQGYYLVTAETVTKPLRVGRNAIRLVIIDRKKERPVEKGLTIEVVPWMPMHEHGVTEMPSIKEESKGEYLVEGLNLSMPGDWEIYVRIKEDGKEDTAVFNLNVIK